MSNNPIRHFLNAAQDLITDTVSEARQDMPNEFAHLEHIIRAGGLLRVTSTFAPTTKLAFLQIVVVEPNGTEHLLSQCELNPAGAT